ncbi:MAG: hypothetical protein L6R36_003919 [Xanthoria steineri]|nr:MAG: hypothetical protein L6R36_003919 [Xanthoria steineri]
MAGTILITAANSSLAIPAIKYLLTKYPDYTALLTVRDASDSDRNTKRLRSTIAKHPRPKKSIHELDLADFSAVHKFADDVIDKIRRGSLPPLVGIACNAFYWNLCREPELTRDGYERSLQVIHIAHAALVLRLLGYFHSDGGRVVVFSSDAHWQGKNGLERYPPTIPGELDLLGKPGPDPTPDNLGRGFQRYTRAKLAIVAWMYALNRYLNEEPRLRDITVVAINPRTLSDSRALRTNCPPMLVFMSRFIFQPLRPLIRFMDPTLRTLAEAGVDVVDLTVRAVHPQARGYFTWLKHDQSSPESMELRTQQMLWKKTLEWARITQENAALPKAFS